MVKFDVAYFYLESILANINVPCTRFATPLCAQYVNPLASNTVKS